MRNREARQASSWARIAGVVAVGLFLVGCSSGPVRVGPQPPVSANLRGEARGSGCGLLLFNVLPVGVNERLTTAYENVRSASAQREITDTKVVERWYLIPVVGTVLCTDLVGTAVE